MYLGFSCPLEFPLPAASCKVRVTLWPHVFSRVCDYVVYMIFPGSSVFRSFIVNKVQRKTLFHVVLFKLECLEMSRIPSRFTVGDGKWQNNDNLLKQ